MKKNVWSIVLCALLALSLAGTCLLLLLRGDNAADSPPGEVKEDYAGEVYVYVAVFKDDPLIINHDAKGLQQFADECGVIAYVAAPSSYNPEELKMILKDVVAKKPTGLMVCGSDLSLTPYVDMAIDAGIPTITVDADLPDSKRLAFIGSDWFDLGVRQAEAMVKLIGGKGRVAMLGMVGLDNMARGFNGYRSVMENYEDVLVMDEYDDESNPEKARELTRQIIERYPDIAGISGFDANSARGIAQALEELGLAGRIKVTSVDITQSNIDLLRRGVVHKLVGQKRELFTYYGGKLLYDINHSDIRITDFDGDNRVTNIPEAADTGLIEVDSSNVADF